jgi:metal-responsive CopG/Arc/MetJ family transcriptional regulator
MRTSISLPEPLFRAAERHAQRSRMSRSQLYADAIAAYLALHSPEKTTETMNAVLAPRALPMVNVAPS